VTLSQKKKRKNHKKGHRVAQGIDPEFKTQYCKKKKKLLKNNHFHLVVFEMMELIPKRFSLAWHGGACL
jgi:hypothetical protein